MTKPALPTWKYNHEYPDRRNLRPVVARVVLVVGLVTVLAVFSAVLAGFDPLKNPAPVVVGVIASTIACLVLVAALASSRKCVTVGSRYLICGTYILYFGNVAAAALDVRGGRLHLTTTAGPGFVLEQHRFPTSARKPDKIARNTAAKFTKVANKILARVQQASPDAVIRQS